MLVKQKNTIVSSLYIKSVKFFFIPLLVSMLFFNCSKEENQDDPYGNSKGSYLGGAIIVKNITSNNFEVEIIICRTALSTAYQFQSIGFNVNEQGFEAELYDTKSLPGMTILKFTSKTNYSSSGCCKFSCYMTTFRNSFFVNCNEEDPSTEELSSTVIVNSTFPNNTANVPDSIFMIRAKKDSLLNYYLRFSDSDDDSLAYELTPSVSSFFWPEVNPNITSDGYLIWENPSQAGYYSFGLNVEDWRTGVKLSSATYMIVVNVEE